MSCFTLFLRQSPATKSPGVIVTPSSPAVNQPASSVSAAPRKGAESLSCPTATKSPSASSSRRSPVSMVLYGDARELVPAQQRGDARAGDEINVIAAP